MTTPTILHFDTSKITAQRQFMESLAPEIFYSGAFGAGKSRVGCEKGLFLSLKYPRNKGLVIRKTLASLKATTMDTWFRHVMPEEYKAAWNKQDGLLTLTNGSQTLFTGMDKASKLGSFECGWIFVDELTEFTEEDYMMLLGRLRHPVPFHQIFGASNPASPSHWAYKRFYQDQELRRKGQVEVVESTTLKNPFTPESYKERLKSFKGRYKDRYVEGKWISFEGLMFDCWDPAVYILPRDSKEMGLTGDSENPIPKDWERYRVIDFGFTNPFVCQWWACSPRRYEGPEGRQDARILRMDERIFVCYREIYHSGITTDEHGREIVRLSSGESIRTTIADWDAGDRALLERAGVPTLRAEKDVARGIQMAYDAIGGGRIYFLEGGLATVDPELAASSKPTCTVEEFATYQKQRDSRGIKNPKEEPQKLNDHGMDCLRYLAATLGLSSLPDGSVRSKSVEQVVAGYKQPLSAAGMVPKVVRDYGRRERESWRRHV